MDHSSLWPIFVGVQEASLMMLLSVFRTRWITSWASGDSAIRSLDSIVGTCIHFSNTLRVLPFFVIGHHTLCKFFFFFSTTSLLVYIPLHCTALLSKYARIIGKSNKMPSFCFYTLHISFRYCIVNLLQKYTDTSWLTVYPALVLHPSYIPETVCINQKWHSHQN